MSNRFELFAEEEPVVKAPKAPVAKKTTPAAPKQQQQQGAKAHNKNAPPQRGNGNRAPKHGGFDRRSGNGFNKDTRKNGGGKFNWGDKEPRKEEVAEAEAEATEAAPVAESTEATEEAAEEVAAEVVPEGPKVRTLDDFLKEKAVVANDKLPARSAVAPTNLKIAREIIHPTEKSARKNKKTVKDTRKAISLDEFVKSLPKAPAAIPAAASAAPRNNKTSTTPRRNNKDGKTFNKDGKAPRAPKATVIKAEN